MGYALLKTIHVSCVVVTFVLFWIRGWWMLSDSPRLRSTWVRVVPHVVDATLLVSAVALTMVIHQYPFAQSWLTVKLLAVAVYIGLGLVALRFGRSRGQRLAAWLGAQVVFVYIVAIALARDPTPLWHNA